MNYELTNEALLFFLLVKYDNILISNNCSLIIHVLFDEKK